MLIFFQKLSLFDPELYSPSVLFQMRQFNCSNLIFPIKYNEIQQKQTKTNTLKCIAVALVYMFVLEIRNNYFARNNFYNQTLYGLCPWISFHLTQQHDLSCLILPHSSK